MAAPSRSLAGTGSAAEPDVGDCNLSYDLGWALGTVFRGYVKATHEALAGLAGGPRGYQVLAASARDGHGSQLALAQRLGVDRTVMTYLLDDLEAAGLIERCPDPADRRARRILATPHGRGTLARLDGRLGAAEEQLLRGLDTEEDRQVFRGLLRRLALHASAGEALRAPCEDAAGIGPAQAAAGRRGAAGRTTPC